MGAIIVLLILGVFIFVSIKINNLKYRAKQQILKNTGISSSDINRGMSSAFEKKHLERFINEHSNYTEESLKEELKQYTNQLINKNLVNEFSDKIHEKIQKDAKLEKLQKMEFKRINISYYNDSKLCATAIYTDNRDEYEINITCNILEDKIQVDDYRISKGAVVGF